MKTTNSHNAARLLWVLLFAILAAGCDESKITGYQPSGLANGKLSVTINTFVQNDSQFSIFAKALKRTGVDQLLEGGTYTLFLPTDIAFNLYLKSKKLNSLDDIPTETLKMLVLHHIIEGKLISHKDFTEDPRTYQPLFGKPLSIGMVSQPFNNLYHMVRVNNIDVQTSNLEPTNGAIHVLKSNALGL